MFQQLQTHSAWKYSSNVWYEKYHTAIELGYTSRTGILRIPNITDDALCRTRIRRTRKGVVTTVYTDSVEYALSVIQYHPNRILSIRSPINESHYNAIKDTTKLVDVRDALYYQQYRFKVHTLKNYKKGFSRDFWCDKCEEANQWIDENFGANSRLQRQASWFMYYAGSFGGTNYEDVKYVYTNDELSLMLYKMAFGDDFHIEITHAFTPQDFSSA